MSGAKQNKILKVKPSSEYPPEKGCFLRGNDYSPVAVVILLNGPYRNLPPEIKSLPQEIKKLVRVAIEHGAALAGTLQTENIGIEKIICNVTANPNIRYLILCGNEVEGHNTGDAIIDLMENGINERRTIMGTKARTAYLFNIPLEAVERFRKQIILLNLLGVIEENTITRIIRSCCKERPAKFKDYTLYDIGAYPYPPISCKLTWKIKHPASIKSWEIDEILK